MIEKRFTHDWSDDFKREVVIDHHNSDYEMMEEQCCELLNTLNNCVQELLWKIGDLGYNNKSCKNCECFITDIHYCWMWDMEVEPNEVVVKCDKRQEKKND